MKEPSDCRDRLDAGGFRQVEEKISLLTWREVQDTELHMHIRSYKKALLTMTSYFVVATIITTLVKIPHSFPLKIKYLQKLNI